jgi:hypothetical protein
LGRFQIHPQVVLPDPKKSEDDVVLFLDPSHSAPEGPEAEQRACVMALEAVAGDRKYDSLLPKQYVAIWKEMGEVSGWGSELLMLTSSVLPGATRTSECSRSVLHQ